MKCIIGTRHTVTIEIEIVTSIGSSVDSVNKIVQEKFKLVNLLTDKVESARNEFVPSSTYARKTQEVSANKLSNAQSIDEFITE